MLINHEYLPQTYEKKKKKIYLFVSTAAALKIEAACSSSSRTQQTTRQTVIESRWMINYIASVFVCAKPITRLYYIIIHLHIS